MARNRNKMKINREGENNEETQRTPPQEEHNIMKGNNDYNIAGGGIKRRSKHNKK